MQMIVTVTMAAWPGGAPPALPARSWRVERHSLANA